MGRPKKKEKEHKEVTPQGPYGSITFFQDLDDEENFIKLVKLVEMMARKALELKDYIKFLKEEVHMDHCHFLKGVSMVSAEVELHHHPLTMYDITETVVRSYVNSDKSPASTFLMAQEVVKLHYDGKVGLIPLSKTTHELVHSGKLFIPPEYVWGNVAGFFAEYKQFISPGLLLKVDSLFTENLDEKHSMNKDVLEEKVMFNPNAVLSLESDSAFNELIEDKSKTPQK